MYPFEETSQPHGTEAVGQPQQARRSPSGHRITTLVRSRWRRFITIGAALLFIVLAGVGMQNHPAASYTLSLLFANAAMGTDLRIANLLLSPEQKPNIEVIFETPIGGEVSLTCPEGWRVVPEAITAEPNQRRFVFTVAQGKPNEKNEYPLSVEVRRTDGTTVHYSQNVHVAAAPNSNLEVAGSNDSGIVAEDWKHAIPFASNLRENPIQIYTVWNRKRLGLLIGIENMKLVSAKREFPFTAVQIALGSVRSDKTFGELYQFLLFSDEAGAGRLVSLSGHQEDSPGHLPNVAVSQAFVWQQEKTVWFEAAIPFAAIPAIKPGEGRELTLSFLIHDAENGTVLDWGKICRLPDENLEHWFRWKGDSLGKTIPAAPRCEWGLCSSKY